MLRILPIKPPASAPSGLPPAKVTFASLKLLLIVIKLPASPLISEMKAPAESFPFTTARFVTLSNVTFPKTFTLIALANSPSNEHEELITRFLTVAFFNPQKSEEFSPFKIRLSITCPCPSNTPVNGIHSPLTQPNGRFCVNLFKSENEMSFWRITLSYKKLFVFGSKARE